MAEYIDKNKILDRLDRLMHIATEPPMDADDKAQWVLLRELHKEFSELPTADVEEVKHGKWIPNSNYNYYYYCSICGRIVRDVTENPNIIFPYCHCGAKMDGGKERV